MEQVEKPQAEGDIGVDEIGEAKHQEIDAQTECGGAVEDFDAGLGDYGGDEIEVVV